jgi:hypothetical protein
LGSHRTTARGVFFLLLVGIFAGTARAASVPAVTAFPVVGNVSYTDDFGDPRPGGRHEGNDIMSRRHQPAIAFERGRVQKHVGSTLGTCMLYLHGRSGMTYVYIHLNNDLTASNDNDGGCRNGVSWAPGLRNGDRVRRGELVGYVGDSGDANGIQPHLHFEVRRPSGRAIDPYPYLRKARHVLYPRPSSAAEIFLGLRHATVVAVGDETLTIRTKTNRLSPRGWRYRYVHKVTLAMTPTTVVERRTADGTAPATLGDAWVGKRVRVRTEAFTPSWTTQRAQPGTLTAERVLLGGNG